MGMIKDVAVSGLNETLQTIVSTQKEHPEQKHYVTLVTFNSVRINKVMDRLPVESVTELKWNDYTPNNCTPLFDAMGQSLTELREHVAGQDVVLVTIITDGMENSSREYNVNIIKNLIKRLQDKGWAITYIGANQDAKQVAHEMNVDIAMCWDSTPEGTAQMSLRSKKIHHEMAKCAYFKMSWDKVKEFVDKMEKEMDGE